jgi:hypothetical protein
VLKFSTYSLRSPEMALVPDNANEADSKKFELEFEEYQKKLKQQKDDWVKQNPDQVLNSLSITYSFKPQSLNLKP